MAEDDVNPVQINQVEILNPEDRMFKSWGSVEVRDRENDLLPMDEFRKIMPVIMKRGGILMDRHSNRQVGKILNFEFKEKETSEGLKEGVMITGEIFRDYEHDDMVWQGIKDGLYKGLSFGGRNKMKDVKFDKSGLTNILQKLEGFEFSLVPGMGNQEATMEQVNYLAKGSDRMKNSVKKTYEADGLHIHTGDNQTGEHTHPEIEKFVEELRQRIEELEFKFMDATNPEGVIELSAKKEYDDKNKKKVLTEKDLSLSSVNKNSEKYIKENDLNKDMEEDQIKKQNEMIENIEKNSNDIKEIAKSVGEVLEILKVKKEAEEEEDKDKEKKKAENDDDKDEDKKKPEEDLEKANGAEGERKVKLPKVPAEETGGGEPAQGGEGEDVKFVEKDFVKKEEFDEVKKQLADLTNKAASTPRPATGLVNKSGEGMKAPKDLRDITKMIKDRN